MVFKAYLEEFNNELQAHELAVRKMNIKAPILSVLLELYKGINNRIVYVLEITDDYKMRVANPTFTLTEEGMRQRLKNIYRDLLFVGTISAIEYHFIRLTGMCTQLVPHGEVVSKERQRQIHLSQIIKWNKGRFKDDFYLWDFAIKLRNDIVHFDARGRQSMGAPKIAHPVIMTEGEEAQGNLRSFTSLTRALENSFFKIIPSIL